MESIDKLHAWAQRRYKGRDLENIVAMLGEIESEIAERYMELPLDAGGVPIRINDEMAYPDGTRFDVAGIGEGGTLFFVENECLSKAYWTSAKDKRHVNPDTWERIIMDAIERGYDDDAANIDEDSFTVKALVERCEKLAGVD